MADFHHVNVSHSSTRLRGVDGSLDLDSALAIGAGNVSAPLGDGAATKVLLGRC
jgi:hypothetical protein